MHISEISQKSGVEARKAGRILRILASKHIFREGEWTLEQTSKTDQMNWNTVSGNVFANNRLSIQLLSNNSLSSLGLHLSVSSTFIIFSSRLTYNDYIPPALTNVSSRPYCSPKSWQTKNGVLHTLHTKLPLINTVVIRILSSNISKGYVLLYVLRFWSTLKRFRERQPLEAPNSERALAWEW